MKRIRFWLAAAIVLLFGLMTAGCTNNTARPSGDYKDFGELLAAYKDGPFTDDGKYGAAFVRNLAHFPQNVCDTGLFEDWTATKSEDGNSTAYETDSKIFGYDTHMTIGVQDKDSRMLAISLEIRSGEADLDRELTAKIQASMNDTVSKPYESYIDGEKVKYSEIESLVSSDDGSKSFYAVWPNNSTKWSALVGYSLSDDGSSKLVINIF